MREQKYTLTDAKAIEVEIGYKTNGSKTYRYFLSKVRYGVFLYSKGCLYYRLLCVCVRACVRAFILVIKSQIVCRSVSIFLKW